MNPDPIDRRRPTGEVGLFQRLGPLRLTVLVALLVVQDRSGSPIQAASNVASGWEAGLARATITPEGPIWMSGYASRTRPSEGVRHDLWAKALVIQDPGGEKAVLVTLDLVGISSDLSDEIRDILARKYGLDRPRVSLACSHTHTGPVVRSNLITMYALDETQRARVRDYAGTLRDTIVAVVGEALEAVEPAEYSWGNGRTDFAVNRRNNKEAEVPDLRARLALEGPTDHDVPVLRVVGSDGMLEAVVFGYACHCTVLSDQQISGDYAGFAQMTLERAHPGVQAMFVAGCGADQNPLPRRTVELAEAYGNQLAESVDRVLATAMNPIGGQLGLRYAIVPLPFAALPTRAQFETEAESDNKILAGRARHLLARLDKEHSLPETYPYPVQVWRLGDGPTWILLGGEVVVDYALRLKRNLGSSRTWVSAYCNDVMAYIPSLRVLNEGGYEGATSMVPYGQPTTWSEEVEELIVAAVERECRGLGRAPTTIPTGVDQPAPKKTENQQD